MGAWLSSRKCRMQLPISLFHNHVVWCYCWPVHSTPHHLPCDNRTHLHLFWCETNRLFSQRTFLYEHYVRRTTSKTKHPIISVRPPDSTWISSSITYGLVVVVWWTALHGHRIWTCHITMCVVMRKLRLWQWTRQKHYYADSSALQDA